VGTLNAIQIPAFSNAPTGTFTNSVSNNSISLQPGAAGITTNGINSAGTSASVTSTLNINNNNFHTFGHTVAGTAAITFITNSGTHQFCNINSNTFTDISVNTTGSVTFISNSVTIPTGGTQNVNGNSIVTGFNKTGVGGTVTFYTTNASSVAGAIVNNSNNNFSNITVTGATTIAGWSNTDGGSPSKTYSNNTFSNIAGGTNAVTIMNLNYGENDVTGNTISNITGGGSITGIARGTSGAVNTNDFSGNTVSGLSSTGISALVTGISIGGTTSTINNFFNNKIFNLEASGTGASVIGLTVGSGTSNYVYNNFISDLRAPNSTLASEPIAQVRGINITSSTSTSTVGIYNNTIYLDATSSGINFGSAGVFHTYNLTGTTASLDMRNNIMVNNSIPSGSGKTAAFRRSAGTNLNNYGTTSNNNAFYAGAPSTSNVLFYDGTNFDQTIAEFKARVTPRETASVSEDVVFVDAASTPYDLRLDLVSPTQCESGGQRITTPIAITTDYFATIRALETGYLGTGSAPDIGAYEGEMQLLDLIAPAINYTALANTSGTSARNIVVTVTDASGVPTVTPGWPNLYWRINSGGWTAATPTDVTGSAYTFSFGTGVAPGDVVEYYVVAQDNVGNVGAFPAAGAGGFTTNPPAAATPPTTPSSYTIVGGIGGALTVGTGGDYPTLTGAGGLFEDINAKVVTSNITATILSDLTEDGTNALNQWNEDAPGNFTVTIKPNTAATPTVSGTYAGGLIRLNGADRVTIDGSNSGSTDRSMTIQNNSAVANTAAIQIISLGNDAGATDNTIKNCNIKAGEIGSTTSIHTFGIYAGSSAISNSGTGADNDNLTIQNNKISKARYGIFIRAAATANTNDNLVITGNEIGSSDPTEYVTFRGLEIAYAQGPVVSQNTIFNLKQNLSASNAGMDFGAGVNDAVITRNNISDIYSESTSGYGAYGINFSSSTSVSNNLVANNTISDIRAVNYSSASTTFNAFGIRLVGGTNTSLYYNSVYLTGSITIVSGTPTQPNSAPLVVTATSVTGLNMVNNVFSNEQSFVSATPKTYSVWFPASYAGFGTVNNNDYYGTTSAPGTYYVGRVGSTDYATLLDWQGFTTQDANSISADPQFVSETNLQPFTGSPVIAAGTPIVGVTTDFTGASRSGTTPSIGAYESGQATAAVGWANLQWPATANITEGQTFNAYARVWQAGVTPGAGQGAGIESWFGWNATNTDPATWTNWIDGTYNAGFVDDNNDEYTAAIGAGITAGTYYYASRFRTTGGTYQYGGYNGSGGNFWGTDGAASGVLTVNPYTVTSFPWTETFEDASPSRSAWTQIQVLGAASWTYATGSSGGTITTAYAGTKNARFVGVSGDGTPVTKIVSPLINLTGVTSPEVFFYYGQQDWGGDQNETKVYYRISPSDPWVELAHYTTSVAAWTPITLALPNPSATYQIAFEGINNYGYANVVDNVTVQGPSTWTGSVSSDWTVSGNWTGGVPGATSNVTVGVAANNPSIATAVTVNNLTINAGGILSIANGGQLTVSGTLTNSAGNGGLVLQSNASGTGSLIHNTADVPATIKRYITGGQYHFASVPLTAAANPTAALFMNSYLWKYDATIPNWVKYLNEADALTVTQGYMIWYTGANTTYSFAGNINNGAFTAATPGAATVFNLVPNPYPSAINWTAASGWTKTNIANAIYIYNNTQYASYVAGVGTNGGTNIIPVGQAFFVQASGGVGTLAMNNSVRTHSSQAYFNDPVVNSVLRVAVAADGKSDETVIRFHEMATATFDADYDASKLYGSSSAPQLYTLSGNDDMMSINALNLVEAVATVPLAFEYTAGGEITLHFSGIESFSTTMKIYLEDLLTGTITDLNQQGSYTFSHVEANDADRFRIHFYDITGIDENGDAFQVWSYDRKVYINIPEFAGKNARIDMFDVLGNKLFSSEGVLNSPTIIRAMNSGVAIVRVSTANRVYTTKLFIQ